MSGKFDGSLKIGGLTAIAAGLIGAALLAGPSFAGVKDTLQISTWSGAYKLSQDKAFFEPFTKKTGTAIEVSTHSKPLDLLKKWKEDAGKSKDVIDLSSFHAEKACDAGYLLPLNEEDISRGSSNEPIETDFMANSLIDCAVPTVAWSALMVVKNGKFLKKKPRSWTDFFNVKRFPGKRSLKKSARYSLEVALLASGVKPNDLYFTLGTKKGQKRAFAILDKVKSNIVWWEKSSEAIKALQDDDVVMGLAYNGRLFNAIIGEGLDITLIWQGQIYDLDYWAIPANSPNRKKALDFINFSTAPARLAEQSKWMPYGPMRTSALKFVGNHHIANVHMSPFLPTTKAHFHKALKFNEGWWLSNEGKKLEDKFSKWLAVEVKAPTKK